VFARRVDAAVPKALVATHAFRNGIMNGDLPKRPPADSGEDNERDDGRDE